MFLPAQDYRRINILIPEKITEGLDSKVDFFIGKFHRRGRILSNLQRDAEQIDTLAADLAKLSANRLKKRLQDYREIFQRRGKGWEHCRFEALAAIREASSRTTGLNPYIVQLIGALALHQGYLAEMATGEGKTLVAGLAAVLHGWTGLPCHVITVNDYLAQRDADWLRPLYDYCGVSVGSVTGQMDPAARHRAYGQDVTYVTSKEILADFLRDRLRIGTIQNASRRNLRHLINPRGILNSGLVMRGIHSAIVDEADSVLIDEAVTPLIISKLQENDTLKDAATISNKVASHLQQDEDYRVNLLYKEIELRKSGLKKIDALCETLPGIWRGPERRLELIKQALTANEFFHQSKQYVIRDDKVVIVDEYTGRMMPQRTWRQGLHQAIEAKHGLEITNPSETLARLSFQRFFRFFQHLSGMTGTAREAASEFWHIYGLPSVAIPGNRPLRRRELPDCVFPDQEEKWEAVAREIIHLNSEGLPVLAGVRNVIASEMLAEKLRAADLEFSLLNAVKHEEEAHIIAQAGQPGRITIATNMAGRGTDIKLGHGVAARGGLQVLLTERHESHRIDRQFFGRCARQGDPGCAQAFVSLDDELLRRFLPEIVRRNLYTAIRYRYPGSQVHVKSAFKYAQSAAQRLAFKQRRQVIKMDTWIDDSLSFAGLADVI